MARAERSSRLSENDKLQAEAAKEYQTRDVPQDWYVDPADPSAEQRFQELQAQYLEDQATAFLSTHDLEETEELASPQAEELRTPTPVRPQTTVAQDEAAVWIGLPSLRPRDEGELAWQADALCAQTDPEAFFPEKGGSTRDAKRVCSACTVRAECLEYALSNDERFGIWGGLSERERRRLRKRAV